MCLKVFSFIAVLYVVFFVLALAGAIIITNVATARAAPPEQITLGDDRPPTIKDITAGGSVGNCDLYLVTIDIPNNFDQVQIVTICGDDRSASGS